MEMKLLNKDLGNFKRHNCNTKIAITKSLTDTEESI